MQKNKYENLLKELNSYLKPPHSDDVKSSVSPTPESFGEKSSNGLYLRSDMDVESLSQNQLLLAHVLLHKFNSSGNKKLDKESIKLLHDKISPKIRHSRFDRLDD